MIRNCDICSSDDIDKLYTQKFRLPSDTYKSSYDVVLCKRCGFAYASNIPSEDELSKYYKKNTKYVYSVDNYKVPEYTKWLHAKSYEFVNKIIQKEAPDKQRGHLKILDVGCGAGYLLNVFREHGYTNIFGFDPAPGCKRAAKELYKIEIDTAVLAEYKTKRRFDLVILGSVLEHMSNLGRVVEQVSRLLTPDGMLFVCVPDGDNMGAILDEPFLEFSLEHINYFTRGSLANLFSTRGYRNIAFESLLVEKYGGYALNSFWRYSNSEQNIKFDGVGKKIILKYIADSENKLARIEKQLERLVRTQEEIYVWGVGSLTSRLLASTQLNKCNILAFVDNNSSLQGQLIAGKLIISPSEIINKETTVLISSYIHSDPIKVALVGKYNHKGSIITLE